MTKPTLSIVESLPPRVGDLAAQLRKLADEIDNGEHEGLTTITAVIDYADCDFQVRLWGNMSGPYDAIGMLDIAKHWLLQNRLDLIP